MKKYSVNNRTPRRYKLGKNSVKVIKIPINFTQGHLEKELNKWGNTLGFFSWMVWYTELLAPGFPLSLNMCLLPCNWETPLTKVGVHFTAPWLWTFFLYWPMECGQKWQHARLNFKHHLFVCPFDFCYHHKKSFLWVAAALWLEPRGEHTESWPEPILQRGVMSTQLDSKSEAEPQPSLV